MQDLKKKSLIVLGVIVAMVLSYLGGRYSGPEKIKTITETIIKIEEKIVEKKIYIKQKQQKKHVEKVIETVKKADGTVVTTTKIITDTDTKTNVSLNETKDVTLNATKEDKKIIIVENAKPQWRVSGKVGVDFSKISLLNVPTANDLTYGIGVERRIIGTVYVGAWGMTNKSGGLSISVDF